MKFLDNAFILKNPKLSLARIQPLRLGCIFPQIWEKNIQLTPKNSSTLIWSNNKKCFISKFEKSHETKDK